MEFNYEKFINTQYETSKKDIAYWMEKLKDYIDHENALMALKTIGNVTAYLGDMLEYGIKKKDLDNAKKYKSKKSFEETEERI